MEALLELGIDEIMFWLKESELYDKREAKAIEKARKLAAKKRR